MHIFIETFLVLSLILSVKSQGARNLTGYQRCYLRDKTVGICVYLSECASMGPPYCGYAGPSTLLACCEQNKIITNRMLDEETTMKSVMPFRNTQKPITKSNGMAEKKCQEYSSRTNSEEAVQTENSNNAPLIGKGENATSMQYPHMAALGYGQLENIDFKCGGSLISEQFVLTAAHCLASQDDPVTLVRLGDLDLVSKTEPAEPQNFKVNMIYIPVEYNNAFAYHDIGLIKLDRKVNFTKYVKPACLETESESKYNNLTITGWGAAADGGSSNRVLQEASVFKLPTMNCIEAYHKSQKFSKGFDEESQICAGNNVTNADACKGDSGGPLQAKIQDSPKMYKVVGVISMGIKCGVVQSVYTKVSKYIPWIESKVWLN